MMRAAAIPMADPRLEPHWLPDPGFLIQGFLVQGLRRTWDSLIWAPFVCVDGQRRRDSVQNVSTRLARCVGGGVIMALQEDTNRCKRVGGYSKKRRMSFWGAFGACFFLSDVFVGGVQRFWAFLPEVSDLFS